LLAASPRLFLGGIERMSGYTRLSVTRATVTGESNIAVHRDGDPESETLRVEVALLPRALTVVAPAATPGDAAGPFAT
jgi:diacylglycerol kinase family enzyme